jgi:hypothetical protein
MTGHVFHPGHQPLHGITVVVETHGELTYVGRFDTEDGRGVHILDAATYEPAATRGSKTDYIRKCAKFGVPADRKHLVVPVGDVARITPLGEFS